MGSGLSMTSVNKIKELAAAREYSLALEIIDSQDLTKSLNPQFVRLCGEIYVANGRYVDARRTLLRAHKMAPEAKRVIYSLVDLYLRMGYKDLADFYYRLYMYDAEPNLPETDQVKYIYSKAQGCPFEEIETLLFPVYSDVMDYEWSYELYLLMKIQGKDDVAKSIGDDYIATFKNEPNVLLIEELEQSTYRLEELFYVYPKDNVEDDSPDQEMIRQEEKALIEADDNRINPKEAEIQILFDDSEKATLGAKLKYKKHIKEQERLAKKAEKNTDDAEEAEEAQESFDDDSDSNAFEEVSVSDDEVSAETVVNKVSIFKKLFSKKKSDDANENDNIEEFSQEVEIEEIHEKVEEEIVSEETVNIVDTSEHEESCEEIADEAEELSSEQTGLEEMVEDTAAEYESEQEPIEDRGDSVMHEIYGKKKISIVTELGEDTFVNTQEIGEELGLGNPFKDMFNRDKEEPVEEEKTSFVFEEAQLQPEDDDFEVDDFSGDVDSFEFDTSEEVSVDDEIKVDNAQEGTVETEIDFQGERHYESEKVEEADIQENYQEEIAETEELQIQEEFVEFEKYDVPDEHQVDSVEVEEYQILEESVETEEIDLQEHYQEETEEAEEVDSQEDYQEVTAETETLRTLEETVEVEEFESIENGHIVDCAYDTKSLLDGESVYNDLKEKGRMDFPEFRTTLFPEYGQEVVEVDNNFNEIMTEAQDKINENLMKEEQMQREAEALLASLGIDLGDIKPTIKPEDATLGLANRVENKSFVKPEPETIVADTPERIEEQVLAEKLEAVHNYSPSRDELKSSLKIDSVKKSILKQIKEYR